jgi:transcriptional regulator with XRE-family HTH domain
MAAPSKNRIASAFGQVLRDARTQAGVSQEALALSCEIDRTYISLLERGLRQPTLSTLFSISDQLGVTAETLVAGTRLRLRSAARK